MNPARVSLIFAIVGWTLVLLNLVFTIALTPTSSLESQLTLIQITPVLFYCLLPTIWIVGATLSAKHVLTLARTNERVPKLSVVALLLNLFGLATILIFLLLTLMIAVQTP